MNALIELKGVLRVRGEFSELDGTERLDRLRLARADGVGPITFRRLIAKFGSAEAAISAQPQRPAARRFSPPSRDAARAEIDAVEDLGARLVVLGDPDYPRRLAEIADPPPVLIAFGDLALAHRRIIAIVGARNASSAGLAMARRLAEGFGEADVVVASGLARGVDGAAHQASLATGAIAVVAGGADVVYPPEHQDLQREIARRGLLLSERPLGARPTGRDFPRRNRIVSGLSEAVVVVEASARSGTLITARLAGEQGRDVFAVPGSPLDKRSEGANRLIQEGAGLAASADDVLAALGGPELRPAAPALFEDLEEETEDPPADLLSAVRERLSHLPAHPDPLARDLGATSSAVAAALVELVLTGEAVEESGGYALAASV